jgi:hypothetical protein
MDLESSRGQSAIINFYVTKKEEFNIKYSTNHYQPLTRNLGYEKLNMHLKGVRE